MNDIKEMVRKRSKRIFRLRGINKGRGLNRILANNDSLRAGHTVYSYIATPKGKFLKFIPASIKDSTRGKVVRLTP